MSEVSLRRREDGTTELRVNGVFVMDDAETTSEELLAKTVVDLGARDVVVGGLGLGFTLRALLDSPRMTSVIVAELEPQIVNWMRGGTIAGADLLADERTTVQIDDIRSVIADLPTASVDAIVLDVDNGPDFLVHDANAAVYESAFMSACATKLRAGGHLCIWSMAASEGLTAALKASFARVESTPVAVRLQDRDEHYWIITGSGPR